MIKIFLITMLTVQVFAYSDSKVTWTDHHGFNSRGYSKARLGIFANIKIEGGKQKGEVKIDSDTFTMQKSDSPLVLLKNKIIVEAKEYGDRYSCKKVNIHAIDYRFNKKAYSNSEYDAIREKLLGYNIHCEK